MALARTFSASLGDLLVNVPKDAQANRQEDAGL